MEAFLNRFHLDFKPHPFNPLGIILKSDPLPLSHTLPFFLGHFVYQGISSQIPALLLDPKPHETILDIAAAPGSKSTQIAALMKNMGKLFINDASVYRQSALNTNLNRCGVTNACVSCLPGQRFGNLFPEYFDKILVDAPCLGLKYLPKDENFFEDSLKNKLPSLIHIQSSLLVSAFKALKPGGTLVYSTCSMTVEENESLIDDFIRQYPMELLDCPSLHLSSAGPGLTAFNEQSFDPSLSKSIRIYPFPDRVESFFVAKLKKKTSLPFVKKREDRPIIPTLSYDDALLKEKMDYLLKNWGVEPEYFKEWRFVLRNKKLWMIQKDWDEVYDLALQGCGIPLLKFKSNHWLLTNSGVQALGSAITQRVLELPEENFKTLFHEGKLSVTGLKNGFYALRRQNTLLATVFVAHGMMTIRLPFSFDLAL